MGVTLHRSGLYRAYKKVGTHVYQQYFSKEDDCIQRQAEFNSLASLKPKKVFSACGRLKGCRFTLRKRGGRKPAIFARFVFGGYGNQRVQERRYTGDFEASWKWLKELWAQNNELLPQDLADYRDEIREAKLLFIKDVGNFENSINS